MSDTIRYALVAGLLGLTACAAPSVVPEALRTTKIQGLYQYGAGDRDLALVVRGNPFAVPQPVVDQAVEQGLAGGGILQPPTHPRLHPDSSARPGYALVIDFANLVSPDDICAAQPVHQVAQSSGEVVVEAAFCVAGRSVSQVRGQVAVQDPNDPAFQELMHQIGAELFRPDELEGGGGDIGK